MLNIRRVTIIIVSIEILIEIIIGVLMTLVETGALGSFHHPDSAWILYELLPLKSCAMFIVYILFAVDTSWLLGILSMMMAVCFPAAIVIGFLRLVHKKTDGPIILILCHIIDMALHIYYLANINYNGPDVNSFVLSAVIPIIIDLFITVMLAVCLFNHVKHLKCIKADS